MPPKYSARNSKPLNLLEKIYIVEIVKGLWTTLKHLLKNVTGLEKIKTYEYPEEVKPIPRNYRAEHRLMLRSDGSIRCTACMLCATACPSKCIDIEAAESVDPKIEKYPKTYDINLLRCVFCGMCVEACPCDAIRMDTQRMDMAGYTRESFIYNKERLMKNHPAGVSPHSTAIY